MTRTIEVKTQNGSYEIRVGRDLLKEVPSYLKELPLGRHAFVIGDTHTRMFVEQLEHFLLKAGFETQTASENTNQNGQTKKGNARRKN